MRLNTAKYMAVAAIIGLAGCTLSPGDARILSAHGAYLSDRSAQRYQDSVRRTEHLNQQRWMGTMQDELQWQQHEILQLQVCPGCYR